MLQKAEMSIEQFDNGITIQWSGPDGEHDSTRIVAKNAEIETSIGEQIWADVSHILDKEMAFKVDIKIEYTV